MVSKWLFRSVNVLGFLIIDQLLILLKNSVSGIMVRISDGNSLLDRVVPCK